MREIKLTLHKSLLSVSQTIVLYVVLLIISKQTCAKIQLLGIMVSLMYVCILYSSTVQ